MDPDNPVVNYCAEGMRCKAKQDFARANLVFEEAWTAAKDDYEQAIAAHYLARQQTRDEDVLHWNLLALEHANKANWEQVKGFYSSLYLNLGHSYEMMQDHVRAQAYYQKAFEGLEQLAEDAYGNMLREAVKNALLRIASIKSR